MGRQNSRILNESLYSTACISLQPLLLNALSLPVMAYIIHRLGPESYGQWMVATSILAVCSILTNLGLRGAFVRRVATDPASAGAALADQLGLRILLAVLAAVLTVLVCRLLEYSPQVLGCAIVGAAGLALTTIATTLADLLQAFQRIKTLAAVNLVAGLALTGVSVVAAYSGTGPVGMAAAYLTGPVLSASLLIAIVRKQCCPVTVRWDMRSFGKLLTGSRFFATQQLLFAMSNQAEALMLPRFVGMNQFGFFTAGTLVANRLTVIPEGLCTAAYPAITKTWASNASRATALVWGYLAVAVVGGIGIALCGCLAADAIGRILFPNNPALFAQVVRITIWSLPLMGVESVIGYALNAAGKDAAQARAYVPAAAASLMISITLFAISGLMGACWAMVFRPAVRATFLTPAFLATFRPVSRVGYTEVAHV